MPFEYEKRIEAIDGNSLVLTLDQNIQYYVDKHLETAVKEQKVNNRAACIVMENAAISLYIIPLLVSGTLSGVLIGLVAGNLVERVKKYIK